MQYKLLYVFSRAMLLQQCKSYTKNAQSKPYTKNTCKLASHTTYTIST